MDTDEPHMITPQEAGAFFVALPKRSLKALREKIVVEYGTAPSLSTLANWGRIYRWKQMVADFETSIQVQVIEKASQMAVDKKWDKVEGLVRLSRECIDKATLALVEGAVKPKSAYDIKTLIQGALDLLTKADTIGLPPNVEQTSPETAGQKADTAEKRPDLAKILGEFNPYERGEDDQPN